MKEKKKTIQFEIVTNKIKNRKNEEMRKYIKKKSSRKQFVFFPHIFTRVNG